MKKQFTGEEATDQATRVLLATLSIPDGAENPSILTKHLDIEEQHVANTRLNFVFFGGHSLNVFQDSLRTFTYAYYSNS